MSPQTAKQAHIDIRTLAYNLTAIAAVLALCGVGVAYLIDGWTAERKSVPDLRTAGPTVEISVAGQQLAIPPSWFHDPDQRNAVFSEQVDLVFALPLGASGRISEIGASLMPPSKARASAQLLDAVYLHQFLPDQIQGPPGLVGKPLKPVDGFESETVWYDPLSANPFVAKCIAPVTQTVQEKCIRTVQLSSTVAVTYQFDREVLDAWKQFDAEAGKWLRRIGGIS